MSFRLSSLIQVFFWSALIVMTGCSSKESGIVGESLSSSANASSSARAVRDFSLARNMNSRLGHGINLGNCLDGYPEEGSWGCRIQPEYMASIKAAGFQSVRIPVRWSNKIEPDGTITPYFTARVAQVVQWAIEAGLVAIVDIHHFDELTGVHDSASTTDVAGKYVGIPYNLDGQITRFYSLWTQISALLAPFPDNMVVLEVLNEPQRRVSGNLYNQLLANVIPIIRTYNPNKTLMTGTASFGQWPGVQYLAIPETESNIILTVHYYTPMNVTHQGTNFSGSPYPSGVIWGNGTEIKTQNAFFKNVADSANYYFPSTDGKGVPIHFGEFGIHTLAPLSTRVAWTRNVRDNCDLYGFSFAYWEFNNQFGAANSDGVWIPEMLGALTGP